MLIALLLLLVGAASLAPGPAAAMTETKTGGECVPLPGSTSFGWREGVGPCPLGEQKAGGASGGAGSPQSSPSGYLDLPGEEVKVFGKAPGRAESPRPCSSFGSCSRPHRLGAGAAIHRDEHAAREPKGRSSGGPKAAKAKAAAEPKAAKPEDSPAKRACATLKAWLDIHYAKALKRWLYVEEMGYVGAGGARRSMNYMEEAQHAAIEWNDRGCGSPIPLLQLPTLSV